LIVRSGKQINKSPNKQITQPAGRYFCGMIRNDERRARLTALGFTLLFLGLIGLYVREFPLLSNTFQVKRLIAGAMLLGTTGGAGFLYAKRARFTPLRRHLPELASILTVVVLFSPLLFSLLNRGLGKTEDQAFEFVSETPYLASSYGILKGDKIKPTGYYLVVRENGRTHRLQYKKQAYYPITRPGEQILLPVRKGLLGFRVAMLK
jgi:hypothetical protein